MRSTSRRSHRGPEPAAPGVPLGVAAVVGVASAVAGGCSDFLAPEDRLRENRAVWEARGLQDYAFRYRMVCGECLMLFVGEVVIEVRGGEVAAVILPGGEEAGPGAREQAPTVEDLFGIVERALADELVRVTVEYDGELGYPRRIAIEPVDEDVVDGEVDHVARDLVPRAVP